MNTKPCPACYGGVSPKAMQCPACGHPLRMSLENKVRWVFGVLLVAIVLVFAYGAYVQSQIEAKYGPPITSKTE